MRGLDKSNSNPKKAANALSYLYNNLLPNLHSAVNFLSVVMMHFPDITYEWKREREKKPSTD